MSYKKYFLISFLLLSLNLFADSYELCNEVDNLNNETIYKKITVNCNNQTQKTTNNNTNFEAEIKLINQKISAYTDLVNGKLNHFKIEVSNQYSIIDWWLTITSVITTITAGILLFLGFKTKKDIIDDVIEKVKPSIEIELTKISKEMLNSDHRSFDKIRLEFIRDLDKIIAEKYETYEDILIELEEKVDKIKNEKNTPIKNTESRKNDDPFI